MCGQGNTCATAGEPFPAEGMARVRRTAARCLRLSGASSPVCKWHLKHNRSALHVFCVTARGQLPLLASGDGGPSLRTEETEGVTARGPQPRVQTPALQHKPCALRCQHVVLTSQAGGWTRGTGAAMATSERTPPTASPGRTRSISHP